VLMLDGAASYDDDVHPALRLVMVMDGDVM
jgi:hypothetical protein